MSTTERLMPMPAWGDVWESADRRYFTYMHEDDEQPGQIAWYIGYYSEAEERGYDFADVVAAWQDVAPAIAWHRSANPWIANLPVLEYGQRAEAVRVASKSGPNRLYTHRRP